MEITNRVTLREADCTTMDNALPKRVMVRACDRDLARWKNISIDQCEDEGKFYVGLSCGNKVGIQIRIEDVPVMMKAVREAYEKQVVKEHKTRWGNK